jgi:DNA-binding transcriptional LysR family regulator
LYTLVVKTGSISKAAQFSNVAIGSASKRISDLELALGTGLLARHSGGVTATPAGEALYRHANAFSKMWTNSPRTSLTPRLASTGS